MLKRLIIVVFVLFNLIQCINAQNKKKVLTYEIKQAIDIPSWRLTQKVFEYAEANNFELIILDLNTYGGLLEVADSIRTKILTSKIPVYVFINNNAASAGALISIACKKIYMKKGSTIGAATVVDQQGNVLPDKYQSYMRSIMRATAEYHGKKTVKTDTGEVEIWYRDPIIAEAMVDPSIKIEGIVDSGKVLSFTAYEAQKYGYCEGIVNSIQEILSLNNINNQEIVVYEPSTLEKIILFLLNPIVQSILIMLIFGGIYFELQTPGIGFPSIVAVVGAILYFAPLYLEGLAEHWEILLFIVGIILLLVEIFMIPSFGVTGVLGIIAIFLGLMFSMIDNLVFSIDSEVFYAVFKAFSIVLLSFLVAFFGSIYLSSKIFSGHGKFKKLVLTTSQKIHEGYVAVDTNISNLIGKEGVTISPLRPTGKISVDDTIYEAISEDGFINVNEKVVVVRFLNNQAYVRRTK